MELIGYLKALIRMGPDNIIFTMEGERNGEKTKPIKVTLTVDEAREILAKGGFYRW